RSATTQENAVPSSLDPSNSSIGASMTLRQRRDRVKKSWLSSAASEMRSPTESTRNWCLHKSRNAPGHDRPQPLPCDVTLPLGNCLSGGLHAATGILGFPDRS